MEENIETVSAPTATEQKKEVGEAADTAVTDKTPVISSTDPAEPAEEKLPEPEKAEKVREEPDTADESKKESESPDGGEDSIPDYAKALEERIALLERSFSEREQELHKMAQENMLRSHYSALQRQSEELQRKIPNFSLKEALEEPEFLRLTSPQVGLSVENAYYALHHGELLEEAERRGAIAVSESISSRSGMPGENGSVRRESLSSQPRLYSHMSPEERQEQKRLILSGMRF